jgi:hypothetical protein
VQYPVLAIRRITSAHEKLEALLRAIDPDVDLWEADDDHRSTPRERCDLATHASPMGWISSSPASF